jgi:uronate dehydrogenase
VLSQPPQRHPDLEFYLRPINAQGQIVHLAAITDEADWESIRASNIDGTYYVFEAARQAGVRRVIYASSHHVYGFYTIDDTLPSKPSYRPSGLYG